ncbi:MAG: hypothetical protein Q8P72_04355 [Candidatus Roizmanbacteria bacterium]|nr:hypothetical protein [Candidatus Roizmanbacteria bacterium]
MKTVPTLLTLDKFELSDQLELFQPYYDRIQIDVADGILVPNVTTQIEELSELISQEYVEIGPNTTFDFHLMVKNFKAELSKIKQLMTQNIKVNTVLINAGLHPKINTLLENYNFSIGLDISPSTEIDEIASHYDLSLIKYIQIMTVEPGFQGSPFLPEMLNKITQLRDHHYSGEILIDGGVNSKTIDVISAQKNRPDIICIGSFLTKAGDDLGSRVSQLKLLE